MIVATYLIVDLGHFVCSLNICIILLYVTYLTNTPHWGEEFIVCVKIVKMVLVGFINSWIKSFYHLSVRDSNDCRTILENQPVKLHLLQLVVYILSVNLSVGEDILYQQTIERSHRASAFSVALQNSW